MTTIGYREVDRNPVIPRLNKNIINLLTRLCFRQDDVVNHADLIFFFSTQHHTQKAVKLITKLLNNQVAPKILITGGNPPYPDTSVEVIESQQILNLLNKSKFPHIDFYSEQTSRNLQENVIHSIPIIKKINPQKILFVTKSHAAGRSYLTLKKQFPRVQLKQITYNVKYENSPHEITKQNWYTFKSGKQRVWGEFLRIKLYGRRGDIEYDDVQDLIIQIENSINKSRYGQKLT